MKKTGKISLFVILLLALLLAGAAARVVWVSEHNFRAKDGESHLLYIYPETDMDSVLRTVLRDYEMRSRHVFAGALRLDDWRNGEVPCLRTGCFRLPAEMSDRVLIGRLRYGRQEPVKMTFRSTRTPEQLASRLSAQLMIDSASIACRLTDSAYMAGYGFTLPQAMCLFIPNTYEVWWNMSADDLFARMHREYKTFWNSERLSLCGQMGLTPCEVVTLASIVEEETSKDVDKPIVAGLYLNRLRRHMLLQADPTVKFAVGDFTLRRILRQHLQYNSPYNTYLYPGLPPGPIRTPSPKTVDYTLHYTPSNYLYMCASPALDGTHRFSASYAEHMRNAREYQRELNRRGIRK